MRHGTTPRTSRAISLMGATLLVSAGLIVAPTFVGAAPPEVVKPSVQDIAIGAPAAPAANVDVIPVDAADQPVASAPSTDVASATPAPDPGSAQSTASDPAASSSSAAPEAASPAPTGSAAPSTGPPAETAGPSAGSAEPPAPEPPAAVTGDPAAPSPSQNAAANDLPSLDGMPSDAQVLLLEPTGTDSFAALGVSWVGDMPTGGLTVSVRVRDGVSGDWTGWENVGLAAVDLPNPDKSQLRQGTDPWWYGESNGVQVGIVIAPDVHIQDAKVTLIDPKQVVQDADVGAPQAGEAGADVAMPEVYSRAQWGADESRRSWDPQYAGTIKAATVHHSADRNNYTAAEVPGIMRSIYQYHAVTLGWGDIGYNVVVDKFGRAWEGRYGGLDSTVVGAHAGGFNWQTFGLSMLGNYDLVPVPSVVQEKMAQLIAWKFQKYGINPGGSTPLTQRGGAGTGVRWSDGTTVTLPTVFGHRDTGYTACPGVYGYSTLPYLRARAAAIMAQFPPDATTGLTRSLRTNTGGVPVYSGPTATAAVIGILAPGEVVRARGDISNGRTYVSGSATGWVSTRFLTENPDVIGNAYAITSGIPARLGPGSGYLLAGEISVNTTASISGEEVDGWIHIVYGGHGAWIEKKWTTTSRPAAAIIPSGVPAQTTAYLTRTNGIPVKSSPSDSAGNQATLTANQVVNASAYVINGYVHLQYGFNGGWVKREFLGSNAAPTRVVATTTGGVPLYTGPSAGYEQVGVVSSNVALSASNLSVGGYTHIHYGQWGAWVPNTWIKDLSATTPELTRVGAANTNGVPVFDASSGSTVLGHLTAGASVGAASGQTAGRIYVGFGATGGWVDARWLVFNPTSTSVYYTTTNGIPAHLGPGAGYQFAGPLSEQLAVQVSTAAPVDGWVNIVYGQTGAWVPQQWLTKPPAIGTTFYTNTGGVPVKMGPGAAYSTIGHYGPATPIAAAATPVDGYIHVAFGSTGGFISSQWLSQNPAPVATRTTTTSGIWVFLGPGPSFYQVGELPVNTQVQIGSAEKDGYIQIVFGGTGGWMDKRWLA